MVTQAAAIFKLVQEAASVRPAAQKPLAASGMDSCPPLTLEVLATLLNGLERNPNLRRIQRYLTIEVAGVPAPKGYIPNNEWLEPRIERH